MAVGTLVCLQFFCLSHLLSQSRASVRRLSDEFKAVEESKEEKRSTSTVALKRKLEDLTEEYENASKKAKAAPVTETESEADSDDSDVDCECERCSEYYGEHCECNDDCGPPGCNCCCHLEN